MLSRSRALRLSAARARAAAPGPMDRFVSNFTNRIDSKGRVSIPSSFRAVLVRDGFDGLFILPTLGSPALDAGGNALIAEIETLLAALPSYSEERDGLSTALYGMSEILKVDPEGRIALTPTAKAHAGLKDAVTFVGLGSKFQLWEPERFRVQLDAARARMRELKRDLGERAGFVASGQPPGARVS